MVNRREDSGKTVGFIGLGAMGRPMANRLLSAGYTVLCHDLAPAAVERLVADGARAAGSAAALAAAAPVVFTMLPEAADVRQALLGLDGAVEGAGEGSVFVDASTIDPMSIQAIGAELDARGTGTTLLDAGVSGNPAMARDATVTLMVGGPQPVVDKCRALLSALCRTLVYTGPLGSAKTVKLANNMVGAATMAAIAEAFDFARRAGVEPAVLYQAMMGSWGRCFQLEVRPPAPGLAEGSPADDGFAPDFSVDYMVKDLRYFLRAAEAHRSPVGVAAATHQLFVASSAAGDGAKDISIVGRALDRRPR
jgi:3-hydroxyisobutyrate dehydrogenase-like beta-hydroxyacid dehydrogenase